MAPFFNLYLQTKIGETRYDLTLLPSLSTGYC